MQLELFNMLNEHFWAIIGILLGGSFVVQITPIKINPWSWILNHIGKMLNQGTNKKIDELSSKVNQIESNVDNLKTDRGRDKVLDARRRILRFSDECSRGLGHSQEYFNDILEDVSSYQKYCEENPKFKNEKAVFSIKIIEEDYENRLKNHDFF